jgi:hypothetical protein
MPYNVSGIAEGREKDAQKLNLAKPFFYLLIYIFSENKKWFLRMEGTNLKL